MVVVPLAIAAMVGLLGVEFQKHSDAVGPDGVVTDLAGHLDRVASADGACWA